MSAPNILDPSALLSALPALLPEPRELPAAHDALAALLHAAMVALSFRLIAVDDASPPSTSTDGALPAAWRAHAPNYTFRYRHEQSALEFVLKVAKLGKRTLVNAIALESEKTASLDVSTDDFTSPSFFPHALAPGAPPLVHGFISSNRVADLIAQFKLKIIQNLMPGLHKPGYAEEPTPSSSSSNNNPRPPQGQPAPARPHPASPPFQPQNPLAVPPRNPLEIGRQDLDPLGGRGNPFAPPPLFPGAGGDGMFVGPGHPIFGNRGPGAQGPGPWGGDGFLPPMGAPPGARFDPVGPFGMGGRGGFGGGFPRGGMPRGGAGLGEPDNDEFLPPGNNHDDMYM